MIITLRIGVNDNEFDAERAEMLEYFAEIRAEYRHLTGREMYPFARKAWHNHSPRSLGNFVYYSQFELDQERRRQADIRQRRKDLLRLNGGRVPPQLHRGQGWNGDDGGRAA